MSHRFIHALARGFLLLALSCVDVFAAEYLLYSPTVFATETGEPQIHQDTLTVSSPPALGIEADFAALESNASNARLSFARRDVDHGQPGGDKGEEFVADLDLRGDGSIDKTEIIGRKANGRSRVKELTNDDQDGLIDVRGFKTKIDFSPVANDEISVSDLVEVGFRFNEERFAIDKDEESENEEEIGGANILNAHELLLFDFSDGPFRAAEVELDIKLSNRDDDGTLEGTVLMLERSGSPDSFAVLGSVAFAQNGNGRVSIGTLDSASVIGIVLGDGEAGQVGVSFGVASVLTGTVIGVGIAHPAPLEGIKVSAGNAVTLTDKDGRFVIEKVPAKQFKLWVDGWNSKYGRFARMHYDIEMPQDGEPLDLLVKLPPVVSLGTVRIDVEVAQVQVLVDGTTVATLRTDLEVSTSGETHKASLFLEKGTAITFEPDVPNELALIYLGLDAMPVPFPIDPVTGYPLYTTNLFAIQPEGVTFSPAPRLTFDDNDGLPVGTPYQLWRYGSWEQEAPDNTPTKAEDGAVDVAGGVDESGTIVAPGDPSQVFPGDWKLTTVEGRAVIKTQDGQLVPVADAAVGGGTGEGVTDSQGRFSFQVVSQPPGLPPQGISLFGAKVLDTGFYVGYDHTPSSNPEGVTETGDLELIRRLNLVSIEPAHGDADVSPDELLSNGIRLKFSDAIDTIGSDPGLLLLRYPMLESLYDQHLLGIPESWGDFDFETYSCNGKDMEWEGSYEFDDSLYDLLTACQLLGDDCPSSSLAGCLEEGECVQPFYDCMSWAGNDAGLQEFCKLNLEDCGNANSCENTVTFDIKGCDFGPQPADYFNQFWFLFVSELEGGIRGENGEYFFEPYGIDISEIFSDEERLPWAISGWPAGGFAIIHPFATQEDSTMAVSPRLGLLIPDTADPSGYQWYDREALGPDVEIEVEPGTLLRVQAEDQSFMKRIVARFGDKTYSQEKWDEDEKPFLMHLDIPVPSGLGDQPVLLDATAEGMAAELLQEVNEKEGHVTRLQVQIKPESPDAQNAQWALEGDAYVLWVDNYGGPINDQRKTTPPPLVGRNATSVSAETLGTYATVSAELLTPVGEELRGSSIDVLAVNISAQGAPMIPEGNVFIGDTGTSFQEVITFVGAERADGSVTTSGTIPCHLEIAGNENRDGDQYDYLGGYAIWFRALQLPEGISIIDPYLLMDYEEYFEEELSLSVLGEVELWGEVEPVFSRVSATFDLPVAGSAALYSNRGYAGVAGDSTLQFSAVYRLICEDPDNPGTKIIYRK